MATLTTWYAVASYFCALLFLQFSLDGKGSWWVSHCPGSCIIKCAVKPLTSSFIFSLSVTSFIGWPRQGSHEVVCFCDFLIFLPSTLPCLLEDLFYNEVETLLVNWFGVGGVLFAFIIRSCFLVGRLAAIFIPTFFQSVPFFLAMRAKGDLGLALVIPALGCLMAFAFSSAFA